MGLNLSARRVVVIKQRMKPPTSSLDLLTSDCRSDCVGQLQAVTVCNLFCPLDVTVSCSVCVIVHKNHIHKNHLRQGAKFCDVLFQVHFIPVDSLLQAFTQTEHSVYSIV